MLRGVFTERRFADAEILVDYRAEKVEFRYPKTTVSPWVYIWLAYAIVYGWILLMFDVLCVIFGASQMMITVAGWNFVCIPTIGVVVTYIMYPKISKNIPKLMAFIAPLLGVRHKTEIIKAGDIPRRGMIKRAFRNIVVEYEAIEEVAEFLERVEIIKTNRKKKSWDVVFIFEKIPKTGELKLRYI